jgi:hypothetical protein
VKLDRISFGRRVATGLLGPFAQLAIAVAAVPALPGIGAVALLIGSAVGWNPLWSEPPLTMSEAAALNDRATIQRLMWSGVDPNAPASVRPPILKSTTLIITPLEAAVGTRTPATLQFLLARGARMDARERAVLFCLAAEDEATEILDFLKQDDTGEKPDCEHVATPW